MQLKDSAAKRHRQSLKRRLRNKISKSKVKTTVRKIQEAIHAKDMDTAKNAYIQYVSLVDKAVTKGTFHRNSAARKKSRLSNLIKSATKA
ncbi:MAG: 30S ribosomal protein S20 [Spirochaetales bacterium]|nr:30S ribosomal protein S20 [Spirochaetales bacterium]